MSQLSEDSSQLVSKFVSAEHLSGNYGASSVQEAAATLIDHGNGDIFAFLKLVRSAHSIQPNSEQRPGKTHLSSSQIHALCALKDYPNDILLSYLELARRNRLSNIPRPI